MSLHGPDHQDLHSVAWTRRATDGPVGPAGDSSAVLEVAARVGLILQPRIRPASRARFRWPGADHGLTAVSAPFANADGIWPRVDTLLSCEDRCSRKLWRVINWQFCGDHVVKPGTRIWPGSVIEGDCPMPAMGGSKLSTPRTSFAQHLELQPTTMAVQPRHMTVASRRKMPAAARISFM